MARQTQRSQIKNYTCEKKNSKHFQIIWIVNWNINKNKTINIIVEKWKLFSIERYDNR